MCGTRLGLAGNGATLVMAAMRGSVPQCLRGLGRVSLKEGEENFCVIVVSLLVLFFCTLTF